MLHQILEPVQRPPVVAETEVDPPLFKEGLGRQLALRVRFQDFLKFLSRLDQLSSPPEILGSSESLLRR